MIYTQVLEIGKNVTLRGATAQSSIKKTIKKIWLSIGKISRKRELILILLKKQSKCHQAYWKEYIYFEKLSIVFITLIKYLGSWNHSLQNWRSDV